MTINKETHGDVALLTISGKMENDPSTLKLHCYVEGLINKGQKNIILDLWNVKGFSSNGLASLLASYTLVQKAGGKFIIVHPTHTINNTLIQTQLTKILKICSSVDEALDGIRIISDNRLE
jgi:anti-anti-sigma factor